MGEGGTPARNQKVTAGLALFAQERDAAALAASVCTRPGHSVRGTCLRMFCFLGNDTLTHPVVCTDDVVLFDCEARGFCCSQDEHKQGDVPGKGFVSTFYLCFCQKLARTCSRQ